MTIVDSRVRGFMGTPALVIATLLACDGAPPQLPAGGSPTHRQKEPVCVSIT